MVPEQLWMRRNTLPDSAEYRIIRSGRRKSIALRIASDGVLEILAPAGVPETFLTGIPEREKLLISRMRRRFDALKPPPLSLEEGALFALSGKFYPLHLSSRLRLFDGGRFIIPRGNDTEKLNSLIGLYRELAGHYLLKRAKQLAESTGLEAESWRITSADTRWGSCNSRKAIALSWKLVQCPPDLIDYVIIHELAHLKELNHSPAFWQIVAAFCPDFRQKRAELKRFARRLPHF